MDASELSAWLALIHCPQFGIQSFKKLQAVLANPLDVLAIDKAQLQHYPLKAAQQKYFQRPNISWANSMSRWMIQNHVRFIPITSELYPELLKQTSRPPIGIFIKGSIEVLNSAQVAVVGSRSPTPYGRQVTKTIISEMARSPITITSGLAVGIDGDAHRTALESELPTIAVMASGHQNIYPKRHRQLAAEIAEFGCVVSEFPPDVLPIQHNFPRRNRIIAGLAKATIVIEATKKSGTLITAQFALDENREVFSVPGNIFNRQSEGCNMLLKQGAQPITKAADIISELQVIKHSQDVTKNHLADNKLLASVDHDTTPVDVIAHRSNLPVEKVLIELIEHEILGNVVAVPGGYIRVST